MSACRQGKNDMRILYVTTISLTMNTFFKPHIDMLVKEGHEVDIACNCNDLNIDEFYIDLGCKVHQIDFSRSPISVNNIRAYRQLTNVIKNGNYDIVHCHTPNASVITRLVCRKFRKKNGLKVFYTAHGFHFYKGAPQLNWMIFYPIEKFCSRYTDKLITINQEDYELARYKFKVKDIVLVSGVGIDLSRFGKISVDKVVKRREISVPEDAFLLLSVGELNENKNHQVVIRAMAKLKDSNLHYVIAGDGDKKDYLLELAANLGVSERVHLLGYRKDIEELIRSADLFCFPSQREGLGLAAIEAMACGLPVLAAENRGTREFVVHEKNGFLCQCFDSDAFADSISRAVNDRNLLERFSENTYDSVKRFDVDNVVSIMEGIYLKHL